MIIRSKSVSLYLVLRPKNHGFLTLFLKLFFSAAQLYYSTDLRAKKGVISSPSRAVL
jgi:hypothetical protein